MSNRETFEQAYNAFVPAADDNPDCIPFYRAYAGLVAAWGKDFKAQYEVVVHHVAASCHHYLEGVDSVYEKALRQLAFYLDHNYQYSIPEEPRYRGFYDQVPQYPGELDAKEYFNREFKRIYPDKRLNSKEAHEKWAANKDKALQILVQQYQEKKAKYDAREKQVEDQNKTARLEFLDKAHAWALFEIEVEKILEEAKSCQSGKH